MEGGEGAVTSAPPCPFSLSSLCAAAFPITTPEPLVLVTPPRCLIANRTQQGVLLSWLPPANHSFPIDRYIMEYRVGEHWEILDSAIPGTDGEFFAKDLSQDTWYEFRVLAVMQDLISEPSNIAGVSSTVPCLGFLPGRGLREKEEQGTELKAKARIEDLRVFISELFCVQWLYVWHLKGSPNTGKTPHG